MFVEKGLCTKSLHVNRVVSCVQNDIQKIGYKTINDKHTPGTGRLAQLVERRTREHNVSGLYRCGFESPAGQLKLLIVFRMRR